jgi:hypothetical protein
MRDFEDEIPGYVHNRAIGERLERLKLAAGPENIGDNLIRCYEELVRLELVGAEEIALVKAWEKDVAEAQGAALAGDKVEPAHPVVNR